MLASFWGPDHKRRDCCRRAKQLGRDALAAGRTISAGEHLSQAAVYFHFAKFLFVSDLHQMRAAYEQAVRCLTDALPYLDSPGRRVEIPFDGSHLVGVLRLPSGTGSHPVMIMIPGLDSAKEELGSTEHLFLERGIATFSVDGPGQGEAEYDLAIRGDWEVPGAAIIDWLSAAEGVDPGRIGVWGVSLGGYYAPRVASGDRRVRACIAPAGPHSFDDGWDSRPILTQVTRGCCSSSTAITAARTWLPSTGRPPPTGPRSGWAQR
jgi:hypothetical protein